MEGLLKVLIHSNFYEYHFHPGVTGSLYLSVWKIKFSKLQQKLYQYCVQIKLRFYLQMRRNITKDQSIYPFCYFPIDLKGWTIGNKSYNTEHFNGENGK